MMKIYAAGNTGTDVREQGVMRATTNRLLSYHYCKDPKQIQYGTLELWAKAKREGK